MDIGSIFLILAILILVVIYISRPLMERSSASVSYSEQDVSTLLAERDQVVATLQELDDDNNLGKIPSEIYPTQRLALLQKGADILRQIDAIQMTPAAVTAEERLEAAVVARRLTSEDTQTTIKKNGNTILVPDDDLEQKIASRRRLRQGKAGGFCPKCGRPVQEVDRFCPKCGATLV
jgi:flagellar biosynthesis/type III secretory pathway M-ring protein FliF/YscJ